MLKLIVTKELREIIGSTKFAVTFLVMATLILLAFYVGARNYQISKQEFEASLTENLNQMQGLTDWGQIDHRVFMAPQPLNALVSGVSNDIGRTVEVRTMGEPEALDSRFNEDPIYAVFRFLDLEFIFTVVLSLFAILFGYDSINGEKERGTLRLAFSNPVPRDKFILGKLIGSFLALAVPLLIPLLIGFALLPVMGIPMDGGEWMRLGLVVLAGLLYLGVFLCLSLFTSALTKHSSSSFLFLLVVWIFAVLIVPRTAVLLAGRAVDVPSVDRMTYEKNTYQEQLWAEDRKEIDRFWRENPEFRNLPREERMRRFRALMNELHVAREDKIAAFADRLNEDRRNREIEQQRIGLGISRMSPASVFSLAATDLAGTSLELKQTFSASVREYQKEYSRFITEKTGSAIGHWWARGSEDEDAEDINPYELPAFVQPEFSTASLTSDALPDIGLLFLYGIVFFVGAFVAFLKYDVR
jgi:ABC-type transport system involved in multi-copper enzyme maturation permease subunit